MFSIKRGMVLRTTRAINVKTEDGTTHKVPSGTRVKAMALTDKGLKIKIQDKSLPTLRNEHIETDWSNVKQVERGRPDDAKPAAKKAGAAAKKTSKPKAAKKVAATPEPDAVDEVAATPEPDAVDEVADFADADEEFADDE